MGGEMEDNPHQLFHSKEVESEDKVEVWWFWSVDCDACRKQIPFMKQLSSRENVVVVEFEVNENAENRELRNKVAKAHGFERMGAFPTPLIAVNGDAWVGRRHNEEVVDVIDRCVESGCKNPLHNV